MSSFTHHKTLGARKWYHDKQALALVTGAISTVITMLNFVASVLKS